MGADYQTLHFRKRGETIGWTGSAAFALDRCGRAVRPPRQLCIHGVGRRGDVLGMLVAGRLPAR